MSVPATASTPDSPPAPLAEWLARGFVAAVAALAAVEEFLPRLLRPDSHSGDLSQHVWWTARFADPDLFPGDFVADFFSLPLFAPPGYRAIFRLAVPFADPQTVAELIPFALTPLLVVFCWRAGRAAAGGALAGAVAGGWLSLRLFPHMSDGLARSFALPLLAMGMAGLLERRLWLLGLSALLAALFYPPLAVNLGLAAVLVLGPGILRVRRLPSGWPALVAFGALALAVMAHSYATPLPADVGPKVTAAEARAMPEFGPHGRSKMFVEGTLETYLGKGRGGWGLELKYSALIAAAVAASLRWLPGAVPAPVWALLFGALLAHALAHVVLFALHLPSRYTLYAIPMFVLLWLASLSGPAWSRLAARFPRLGRPALLGAAAFAWLALTAPGAVEDTLERVQRPTNVGRESAFAFVATLPEDALVAAHPEDADSIPLRTHRSVLASKEVALPYYLGYYRRLAERLEAGLRAFYAPDWSEVEALRERYGADVMVVNRGRFDLASRIFDEPFGTRLADRLAPGPYDRYVLYSPPEDRILFQRGPWTIVRLGPPRPGYETVAERQAPRKNTPAAAGTR
jgi:hypothetical protein